MSQKAATLRKHTLNRALSTKVDSFLSGSSSVYIEQMYDSWRKEPSRYVKVVAQIHICFQSFNTTKTAILTTASTHHGTLTLPISMPESTTSNHLYRLHPFQALSALKCQVCPVIAHNLSHQTPLVCHI